MTVAATANSLSFNMTTNGNAQLLAERMRAIVEDPATLGVMLAAVYALASLAQVVVGRLIDRISLKRAVPDDHAARRCRCSCWPRRRRAGGCTPRSPA